MEGEPRYRLGCPVFGARGWVGSVLPQGTRPDDQLSEYARLFSAVEGNGTFYGLPKPETVARWGTSVPEEFRFAFKLPRVLTHDHGLRSNFQVLEHFLSLLRPLGVRVGPVMVQLPPSAGRRVLDPLDRFLDRLPEYLPRSVELRHPDFFDDGRHERDLHRILTRHRAERVCLDSRALFGASPDDLSTAQAQQRKPRVPPRFVGLGPAPVVRFIGRNQAEACDRELEEWARVVGAWMREGRRPYVFCHAPDERHAPDLARRFHGFLRRRVPELPPLPDWPLRPKAGGLQLSLL